MTSTPDLSKTQSSPGLPGKEVPTSAAPYSHLLLRFAEDGPCRRTGIRPHPRLTKCTVTRLRSTPAGTNQSALDRPQPSPASKAPCLYVPRTSFEYVTHATSSSCQESGRCSAQVTESSEQTGAAH
ncbi:LOW QUALITY PROTEIN: conserved hypothetical protein, partial [Streptomyces lividans TK24]